MSRHKLTLAHHGVLAFVVLGAVLIGALCARPPAGQSQRTPAGQKQAPDESPPGHFLAGGERSVPVLVEISATLKRIAERLERMEKFAQRLAESDRKE